MWQIAPLSPTPLSCLRQFFPKTALKTKLTQLVLSKRQYLSQSNHLHNYSKSYLSVNQHVWWVVRLSIAVWMEAVVLRHGSKTLQSSYSSGYMHLMGRSKARTHTHTHTHTHNDSPPCLKHQNLHDIQYYWTEIKDATTMQNRSAGNVFVIIPT